MKEKFRSALGMSYFIYVPLFISIINKAVQIGLFKDNNPITHIFEKINFESPVGVGSTLFFIIFYSITFYIIKSDTDKIIIYEDENIKNKIHKKLIIYKIIVVLTIGFGTYITLASNNIDILFTSIFLIIDSVLILYAKEGYLKSYLYNRQLRWFKEINNEDIYKDTYKWRKKCKFNGYVKINLKHRYMNILKYIPTIVFAIVFMMPDSILIRLLMGYILLFNIAAVIEILFSLYTSTKGVCTSVKRCSNKGNRYYIIVVTDYENKTEMEFRIEELFNLCEMDTVEVVYGVFSKRCIMINNFINMPKKSLKSTYFSLFAFLVIIIGIFIKTFTVHTNEHEYKNATYEDTEYKNDIEYMDNPDIVLTGQEILDLYENTKKDKLDYEIFHPEEYYVESTFNTFEDYEGMVKRQIVDEKRYGQILYPYSYDSYDNNITLQRKSAMYLISLVLPSDAKEERSLVNEGYGIESRVYSSSRGTFVVRMQRKQYFNGTEPYYNKDEIVDIKYLKLIE